MATKRKTTRTTPTGIRFDLEKLSFILANEKLGTRQGVVDFLMDSYWWKNKPQFEPTSSVKHIPPSKMEVVEQVVKDLTKPTNEVKPKEQPKSNFTIDTRPKDEPKEGSMAFYSKYGVATYAEIKKS